MTKGWGERGSRLGSGGERWTTCGQLTSKGGQGVKEAALLRACSGSLAGVHVLCASRKLDKTVFWGSQAGKGVASAKAQDFVGLGLQRTLTKEGKCLLARNQLPSSNHSPRV